MLNCQQHDLNVVICSFLLRNTEDFLLPTHHITSQATLPSLSFVLKRDGGDLLFTYTTFPLHLMEKPCHVSQDLVLSAVPHNRHARHKSAVVKHWETWPILRGVVYPVLGLICVNKLQQPRGAVHGAEIEDLSSTAGTAASLSHDALWLLNPSL